MFWMHRWDASMVLHLWFVVSVVVLMRLRLSFQWVFDNLNDEAYLRRVIMPLEVGAHSMINVCSSSVL
jgi:hypothetical protein